MYACVSCVVCPRPNLFACLGVITCRALNKCGALGAVQPCRHAEPEKHAERAQHELKNLHCAQLTVLAKLHTSHLGVRTLLLVQGVFPGFQRIDVTARITADASAEQLEALRQKVTADLLILI